MIDVVANVAALEAGATRIETLEVLFQIGMAALRQKRPIRNGRLGENNGQRF